MSDQELCQLPVTTQPIREIKGLTIIVDNMEAVADDQPNSSQMKCREEVQELTHVFKNKFGFLVLCFNSLSKKSIFLLLSIATEFDATLNAFVLIILSKGKTPEIYDNKDEIIPIAEVLGHFSDENCPHQLINKPKLFFFQTILTQDITVCERRLQTVPNSVFLSAYPRGESEVPLFVDRMQTLCDTTEIGNIFNKIKEQLRDKNVRVECRVNLDLQCDKILATRSLHSNDETSIGYLQHIDQQRQISLAMWCPVRRQTIEFLENQREDILKIVRDVRIAKIVGSTTSLIGGGALTITGIVLIPFTLGASIGLTLAGAGVGALGAATTFGAAIVSKLMTSSKLKEAHEHIKFDHQLSLNVNNIANEYNRVFQKTAELSNFDKAHFTVNAGSRAGTGVAKGAAIALASGGVLARVGTVGLKAAAIAGGVAGGVALVVTVPLDIYQIISNGYDLVRSARNGENDRDSTCRWYMEKIREMERELYRIEHHDELGENDDESDDETRRLVRSTHT